MKPTFDNWMIDYNKMPDGWITKINLSQDWTDISLNEWLIMKWLMNSDNKMMVWTKNVVDIWMIEKINYLTIWMIKNKMVVDWFDLKLIDGWMIDELNNNDELMESWYCLLME
jgi:hypothetical protein